MDNIYIPMELEYVEPFSFDDYDDCRLADCNCILGATEYDADISKMV